MTHVKPQTISHFRCQCGENPIWHVDEKCLYWLDNQTGRIFRYRPGDDRAEQVYSGENVFGMTVQSDGELLLFMDRCQVVGWRQGLTRCLLDGIPGYDNENFAFNDVIADPVGRVFCGTIDREFQRPGHLFRLDPDGAFTPLLKGIGCSNGLGFSLDISTLYYTDSLSRTVYRFDYHQGNGAIHNQQTLIELEEGTMPDGLTVDAEGNIWIAVWEGSVVSCYGPNGEWRRSIEIPTAKVTSLTFGGDDCSDIYITTAAVQSPPEDTAAGALFRLENSASRGRAEFNSAILIDSGTASPGMNT